MDLTNKNKNDIRFMLQAYVDRFSNRTKALEGLSNVSERSVSSILNEHFEHISDTLWKSIRDQVSEKKAPDWVVVNTPVIEDLMFFFGETQEDMDFAWAISPSGSGKTEAALLYQRENKNVFYLEGDAAMAKADFALELAKAVGLRLNFQKKARTIIIEVIELLSELENPLLIIDEANKLSDNILNYFITIYNRLKGKAAVAFLSPDQMVKRMESCLRYNKPGFQEIWGRLGSSFYFVDQNESFHVEAIIRANGINQDREVAKLVQETEAADLNLRRTYKKVIKYKKQIAAMGGKIKGTEHGESIFTQ